MRLCTEVSILVLTLSSLLFGQDTISAGGFGEGVNRDEALMAAKRDAIEKGIGTILLSQTEIENFQVKRDLVVTKTIGAVKNYDVISETKSSDKLFQIRIRATLSKTAMKEDLAAFQILIESMDKPKVMVVIDENNIGNNEPSNHSAETAVQGFLKDPYEFELVDQKTTESIKNSKEKMAQLNGDAAAAASIAGKFGAEVLIYGTAVSRQAEGLNLGGMVSVQADVTLKAINCATGRIIGTSSEHAAKVHVGPNTAGNQAIESAALKAAGKLLDAIIKDWQGGLNNGVSLSVSVNGVSSFRMKTSVVAALQSVAGVAAVRERSWDATSSILRTDIQYKGNANGFCSKVDGSKIVDAGANLSVTAVDGSSISLTAK